MNDIDNKIYGYEKFKDLLSVDSENITVSFLNPFSYEVIRSDSVVERIDYFFIDGKLFRFFFNFFNRKNYERVSFDYSSIASEVFCFCQENQLKVGFVGGTVSEISKAVSTFQTQFPKLDIVYYRNGFFNNDIDINESFIDLETLKVDIIIVGMGTPFQEKYISKLKGNVSKFKVCFTCGGFLTQTSIRPDYYHPLIKKLGLMWLQRIFLHKHVRHKVFKYYPKFIFNYIRYKLR